ncbi:GtrA family protein [Polaromonas sp.]|uniref:GtrA family protein n=2 Tax=Burkholderiales TaxID=80840 RepID=UPI0025EE771E|nr:GtrA family protein [Polaromonas sp.]
MSSEANTDFRPVIKFLSTHKVLKRFSGFSLIGIFNTLIHLSVVTGLVEFFHVFPVWANCLAFAAANSFSFWANSRWNYGTPLTGDRYRRFLVVSLAGLAITAACTAFAEMMGWHYLIGTALVFVALPALTFMAHHRWTWAE